MKINLVGPMKRIEFKGPVYPAGDRVPRAQSWSQGLGRELEGERIVAGP